jgi:hypothetical protein
MKVVLSICCVRKNRRFRLYKPDVLVLMVLRENQMVWFVKPDCLILTDRAYVSPVLIVVVLLSCASRNTCSHTYFLHLLDA